MHSPCSLFQFCCIPQSYLLSWHTNNSEDWSWFAKLHHSVISSDQTGFGILLSLMNSKPKRKVNSKNCLRWSNSIFQRSYLDEKNLLRLSIQDASSQRNCRSVADSRGLCCWGPGHTTADLKSAGVFILSGLSNVVWARPGLLSSDCGVGRQGEGTALSSLPTHRKTEGVFRAVVKQISTLCHSQHLTAAVQSAMIHPTNIQSTDVCCRLTRKHISSSPCHFRGSGSIFPSGICTFTRHIHKDMGLKHFWMSLTHWV